MIKRWLTNDDDNDDDDDDDERTSASGVIGWCGRWDGME